MPPEQQDMVPPTLELAIAGSVAFGVALNQAFHRPHEQLRSQHCSFANDTWHSTEPAK